MILLKIVKILYVTSKLQLHKQNKNITKTIDFFSVVMHSVLSIEDWNYRHIDLILDTGDQLFIDSYIAYGPKDPKLGMENILRKFFMGNLEVSFRD